MVDDSVLLSGDGDGAAAVATPGRSICHVGCDCLSGVCLYPHPPPQPALHAPPPRANPLQPSPPPWPPRRRLLPPPSAPSPNPVLLQYPSPGAEPRTSPPGAGDPRMSTMEAVARALRLLELKGKGEELEEAMLGSGVAPGDGSLRTVKPRVKMMKKELSQGQMLYRLHCLSSRCAYFLASLLVQLYRWTPHACMHPAGEIFVFSLFGQTEVLAWGGVSMAETLRPPPSECCAPELSSPRLPTRQVLPASDQRGSSCPWAQRATRNPSQKTTATTMHRRLAPARSC